VSAVVRRTQVERRETTVRKLLDAATESLVEHGYAGASVQVICARAGISHGGLFRHFPTREALMVAVGAEVGASIIDKSRAEFRVRSKKGDPLELALRMVRERCHSRRNRAWFELAVAARTNPALREALEPVAKRYHDDIEALARELLPEVALALGPAFRVLVDSVISIFDGEVLHGFVLDRPEIEAARLALLGQAVKTLLPAKPTRPARRRKG
jgi:AcrR family transcriptional regulator